jgi:transposase
MDTNPPKAIHPGSVRGPYRRHSLAFKRAVVELALQPGASVARIAREHDLNTNQVFGWRRAYQEGLLGEPGSPALLPVEIVSTPLAETANREPTALAQTADGVLVIESRHGRLRVQGRADAMTLRLVLEQLLR